MESEHSEEITILSVNVGKAEPISGAKPSGMTGIFKRSITCAAITSLGLAGDAIVDTANHGGPDQAVYVFTRPDYEWWSHKLDKTLDPGTFGENLTLSKLESATLNIGDRLRVGNVLLEITAPRVPCVTIAARMKDPQFVRKFREAERPGVYCRVLLPGRICRGGSVTYIPYEGPPVPVVELYRAFFRRDLTNAELKRLLSVPIPNKIRPYYQDLLSSAFE
jgi:MOSC domain-containing protein YiiM